MNVDGMVHCLFSKSSSIGVFWNANDDGDQTDSSDVDFAGIYQSRFNEQRALSVLARTFRSDIHSAVSTKLIDTNQLELTMLAGSRIVYESRLENFPPSVSC